MGWGGSVAVFSRFNTHRAGGNYLLVHGESGAWLVVDEEACRALGPWSGKSHPVEDLHRRFGPELAGQLLESGLVLTDENRNEWSGLPGWSDPDQIFVVLHLTDRCRFSCSYCYADSESRGPGRAMSGEVLDRVIALLVHSDRSRITIGLHGGEPLLWLRENRERLEGALRVLEAAGKRVHLHTQTSGAVLDEDSLRFIKDRSIAVGVSCDGPPDLNDTYRKWSSGRGTSKIVELCFDTLDRMEIPFGVICSVGAHSVGRAADIVEYFRERGIRRVRFNPVWAYPRARSAGVAVDPRRFLHFYLELMELIRRQNGDRHSRMMSVDLGWMLKNLRSRDRAFMCMRSPCGAGGNPMLAVDPDGDLYPCEKMVALPELRAGSIFDRPMLADLLELPAMVGVRKRTVHSIKECRSCDWRAFCGGGCPADAMAMGHRLQRPDPNCFFYKNIFKTLMVRLVEDESFLEDVCPPELRRRMCAGRADEMEEAAGAC